MSSRYRINPERKICLCGKRVRNHHWFCDKCWGKRKRAEVALERKKMLVAELKKSTHIKRHGGIIGEINKKK